MLLKGSCHCGAVRFSVRSETPVPYMHCYCSICRKTGGGAGSAINIMGLADTLRVEGRRSIGVYQAKTSPRARKPSPGKRHFCKRCGSALWVADPRWPDWIYPFASAIDTPLPRPRERVHILLDSKPDWVIVPRGAKENHFTSYPDESIIDWHRKRGCLVRR